MQTRAHTWHINSRGRLDGFDVGQKPQSLHETSTEIADGGVALHCASKYHEKQHARLDASQHVTARGTKYC